MIKLTKNLLLGVLIAIPVSGKAIIPVVTSTCTQLQMYCQIIDDPSSMGKNHRTPPQIPNVYLEASTSTVYFENPCYECTLELVIPGTDTVVYTSAIEDGAETFQIPNGFIGTYELHIHRGNYCFWGEIVL